MGMGDLAIGCCNCGGGGTGTGGSFANCSCTSGPATLTMTSSDPSADYDMFQPGTLTYKPTPPEFSGLNLGAYGYFGDQQWPDPIAGDSLFVYYLSCRFNQFTLTRLYADSPYGSPYRDGIRYTWLIGVSGNTCTPFRLTNGQAYQGSDPVNVTLQ